MSPGEDHVSVAEYFLNGVRSTAAQVDAQVEVAEAQVYATLAVYEALVDLARAVREHGPDPLAGEPLPPSEP